MPKPITIDYAAVEQNPDRAAIKWGNKEVIGKVFSLKSGTVTKWIADMREHPDFRKYVINPTHKIVLIHLDGFEQYALWLEENRYRRSR